MVAEFPGLEEVGDREKDAEEDADACYGDVGDAEEGVLAAYHSACADDDGLGAAVFRHAEIWVWLGIKTERMCRDRGRAKRRQHTMVDGKAVTTSLHYRGIIPLRQFAESWQTCQSHPDLERLIVL